MVIIEEVLALKIAGDRVSQKWDERFLGIARLISTWSKDPSTKVGAVAVSVDRRILAQGYNGFPSGAKDSPILYDDRMTKYHWTVHAEANVIFNACNFGTQLHLSTVYIYGMYPCPECVKSLAQVGVARIVFQIGYSENVHKWEELFHDVSKNIMHNLGIGFTYYAEQANECIHCNPKYKPQGKDNWCYCKCHPIDF